MPQVRIPWKLPLPASDALAKTSRSQLGTLESTQSGPGHYATVVDARRGCEAHPSGQTLWRRSCTALVESASQESLASGRSSTAVSSSIKSDNTFVDGAHSVVFVKGYTSIAKGKGPVSDDIWTQIADE